MTSSESTQRTCLDCGEPLFGRVDKKFCSDQCRNSYNNKFKKHVNDHMRQVNLTLKRNRRILEKLNPEGKTKVKKDSLLKEGFDFEYHTNSYVTKKGQTYFFCYEQGYLEISPGWFILVKRKDDWD